MDEHSVAYPRVLAECLGFWEHWGFSPWKQGRFLGVERKQHFVKSGLLGNVAEYKALDYILWGVGTHEEREELWHSLSPRPEVMTQRFLFLLNTPWTGRRVRSFALGFKGYAEFFALDPSLPFVPKQAKAADLTGLVALALSLS